MKTQWTVIAKWFDGAAKTEMVRMRRHDQYGRCREMVATAMRPWRKGERRLAVVAAAERKAAEIGGSVHHITDDAAVLAVGGQRWKYSAEDLGVGRQTAR